MPRIIDAFTQFFDDEGNPLVNGFLKFDESGTNNTDKDTFADPNEEIPNTNPVQLDGAGRCPNVFGTGAYNVISFTNDMQQIQQFDPVTAGTSSGAYSYWDAVNIYDLGSLVRGDDSLYYRSLINGNQNNNPITSPDEWERHYLTREMHKKGLDLGDADISGGILTIAPTILSVTGDYFDIDGTDDITGIAPIDDGRVVYLHFLTVRNLINGAGFDLKNNGSDIITSIGDYAEFYDRGAGSYELQSYMKADQPAFPTFPDPPIFLQQDFASATGDVGVTGTTTTSGLSIPLTKQTETSDLLVWAATTGSMGSPSTPAAGGVAVSINGGGSFEGPQSQSAVWLGAGNNWHGGTAQASTFWRYSGVAAGAVTIDHAISNSSGGYTSEERILMVMEIEP